MSFNYGIERRRFEAEWVKLRTQYREAGFPEDKINAMYAFDEDVFRNQRRYEIHSQPMPSEEFGEDDWKYRTSMYLKFKQLTVTFDEGDFPGRYAWIDTVDDPNLASRLKQLKQSDLELITMITVEGYSQLDIAYIMGCSQKNISIKMKRIKKILQNF